MMGVGWVCNNSHSNQMLVSTSLVQMRAPEYGCTTPFTKTLSSVGDLRLWPFDLGTNGGGDWGLEREGVKSFRLNTSLFQLSLSCRFCWWWPFENVVTTTVPLPLLVVGLQKNTDLQKDTSGSHVWFNLIQNTSTLTHNNPGCPVPRVNFKTSTQPTVVNTIGFISGSLQLVFNRKDLRILTMFRTLNV